MADQDLQHSISALVQAHEYLQKQDQTKDEFIRMMIDKIRGLQERVEAQDREMEHKTTLADVYYKNMKQAESELARFRAKQEQSSFTLVLLDGDIMLFLDEHIDKGFDGGKDAARALKTASEEYSSEMGLPSRILVQIYANVSGLKKLYNSSDVTGFIQGFNMFDGLFHIVDAGKGKECSDEKVKKLFELFIKDTHCHHIVLGVSADNGYARLLEPYAGNDKLTLLEGPPFASELASIVKQSQTTQFRDVFRSTKKETPSYQTPAFTAAEVLPPRTHPTSSGPAQPPADNSSGTTGTYAALASRPATMKFQNQSSQELKTSTSRSAPFEDGFPIFQNARGERVDEKLKVLPKDIEAVKGRKLCNNYHLFNNCVNDDNECPHRHGPRLSEVEQLAQRALARTTPCYAGSDCTSVWCTCGHQCHFGPSCNRGSQCRFPHVSDTKPVKTITVR